MKRAAVLLLLFTALHADEPAAPAPVPGAAMPHGRLEIEINGQRRVFDLSQPGIIRELIGGEAKPVPSLPDPGAAEAFARALLPGERLPVRTGPVTYLGVAAMEVPREVAAQLPLAPDTGLLVAGVAPGSPAAAAGLMENDVITRLDDQIIITTRQLAVLIANRRKDEAVKLQLFRKGQPLEITATLGQREIPAPAPPAVVPEPATKKDPP